MAQKKPGGLVIYFDHLRFSRFLSDAERGRLILDLADYAESGVLPSELSGATAICFEMMREAVDRNNERYTEACERNRAKANKRWGKMPQDATACNGMPRHGLASNFMPNDADTMPSDAADANLNLNLNGTESLLSVANAPPAKKKRFSPPSVEEVAAYCDERKNGVDPQRFVDYYGSVGWKVGKNPMKDWKACVRTWEQRRSNSGERTGGVYSFDDVYERF